MTTSKDLNYKYMCSFKVIRYSVTKNVGEYESEIKKDLEDTLLTFLRSCY